MWCADQRCRLVAAMALLEGAGSLTVGRPVLGDRTERWQLAAANGDLSVCSESALIGQCP
jgi:hypothetical protein